MTSPLKNSQINQIAEFNHEVNRLFSRLFLKDLSIDHYSELNDFEQESIRSFVRKAGDINEQCIECRGPFGGGGPHPYSSLHEYWMTKQLKSGWRYGPERDTEEKTDPRLLPYNDLSIRYLMPTMFFYDNFVRTMSFQQILEQEGKKKK